MAPKGFRTPFARTAPRCEWSPSPVRGNWAQNGKVGTFGERETSNESDPSSLRSKERTPGAAAWLAAARVSILIGMVGGFLFILWKIGDRLWHRDPDEDRY
jgi:hypothetical protein